MPTEIKDVDKEPCEEEKTMTGKMKTADVTRDIEGKEQEDDLVDPETPEEECDTCHLNVGAGMTLAICDFMAETQDAKDKVNCTELRDKFERGDIGVFDLIDELEKTASPEIKESLQTIRTAVQETDKKVKEGKKDDSGK